MAPGLPDEVVVPVPQRLGSRGFSFRIVVQSPMEHDLELVATGLVGHFGRDTPLTGSLHHMDEALGGALSSWRENGAESTPGDIKAFTPPRNGAIRARALVAVWLGMDTDVDVGRVALAAGRVVDEAVKRRVDRVGFAPGVVDGGLHLPVKELSRAIASAVAATYEGLDSAYALSFELEVSPPRRDDTVRGAREALATLEDHTRS
jgi:hypothetical protein